MEVCPTKAIFIDAKIGAVQINERLCIGCRACLDVCHFGGICIDPKTSKPIKCDLCEGEPACVEVCPKEAIKFNRIDVLPRLRMQSITVERSEKHWGAH
jgi:Fe-S-cluster-containing dehydrogenase component